MHTVDGRSYSKSLKPQLYPVDGRTSCMFSLCMHPALFISSLSLYYAAAAGQHTSITIKKERYS